MALSAEDKVVIKVLRQQRGYNVCRFLKEFPDKNWSQSQLYRLISQIDSNGSTDRKKAPGSGRPKLSRTGTNIEAVEDLVLSQEDAPGTHRTQRQIAREIGISQRSVGRIIHCDLKLKCLEKEACTGAHRGQQAHTSCTRQTVAEKISRESRRLYLVHRREAVHCTATNE